MNSNNVNNPDTLLIDPWAMQQTLMAASGQKTPKAPELNPGVLLYAALNLEEGSEILRGLNKALERISSSSTDPSVAKSLNTIMNHLADAEEVMHGHSLAVRAQVAELPKDFSAALKRKEVIEMADGTTDLTVTNSGFALSLGVNGAACYQDVAGSNLSKRNPDTLVIDKTPDGKWIKGSGYQEPNLAQVIYGDTPDPDQAPQSNKAIKP